MTLLHTSHALSIRGNTLIDIHGKKLILKGVSIPDPEHLNIKRWERTNIDALKLVKLAVINYKANVVRVPILIFKDEDSSFLKNPSKYFKSHLRPILEFTHSQKVFVIIDFHYEGNFLNIKEKLFDFWNKMSPFLINYEYTIPEIFNEPVLPNSWTIWRNKIAIPLIRQIRRYLPNRPLIVGSPLWNTVYDGLKSTPILDKSIIYSLHIYPNQWFSENCQEKYKYLVDNFPVFMTEWGYDQYDSNIKLRGNNENYAIPLTEWMHSKSIHWTIWSFDQLWNPSFFDEKWRPKLSPFGMGEFVKDLLINKNQ